MSKFMGSKRGAYDPELRNRPRINTVPTEACAIAVLLERAAFDEERRFAFVVGQNSRLIVVEIAVAYHQKPTSEPDTRAIAMGDFGPRKPHVLDSDRVTVDDPNSLAFA